MGRHRCSWSMRIVGLLLGVTFFLTPGYAQDEQTFTVLYNEIAETPFRDDWLILREYEERMGVRLHIRLGDNADYVSDVANALESGLAPDIVLKVWPEEVEAYAASGMLLAFSDYMEFMPHFQAHIEAHGLTDEVDRLRLSDGNLYILPGFQREVQVQQWIYRKDLFEEHGLGVPATYEELYEALQALLQAHPQGTPLTACWGGAHLFAMIGAGYGIPAGWSGIRHYSPADDAWVFAPATNAHSEMLRFLSRCYEAGVLDPGVYTQTVEEYLTKLQDGRAFAAVTWISSGFENWNAQLRENGVTEGTWAPFPVPESTIGIRALPAVNPFRKGLVVPARMAADPRLEDLLRFLDWAVYSEEGMTLTAWGVEGVTFIESETGRELLPHIASPKTPEGTTSLTAEYGFATLFDLNENAEFEDYKRPDDVVAFLGQSLAREETLDPAPLLELGSSEIQAIAALGEDLGAFAAAAGVDFVTGALDIDSDWDAYIRSLIERGSQTLEAIWNSAWSAED